MAPLNPFRRLGKYRGLEYLLAILVTGLFTLFFLPFRTEGGQDNTTLSHVWDPSDADRVEWLRVYIRQLRKKPEDDPDHPHMIRNEPGIGYRFLVDE